MNKLTADLVVAKLSSLGYNLITSDYELERVEHGELLNHRLSYRLKDTNDKTGKVTFIDGRTSFKQGLAIDMSIVDSNDIQRPIKVNENDKFVKLISIDYEKEQKTSDKLTEDTTTQIDKKVDKLDLSVSNTKELIIKNLEAIESRFDRLDTNLSHLEEIQIKYFRRLFEKIHTCTTIILFFVLISMLVVSSIH